MSIDEIIGVQGRLGAYLNDMVSDLELDNKGDYLRELFGKFEVEAKQALLKEREGGE